MITGNSEKNVVTVALKMGAADFIVKPFVREILIAKVAQALGAKIPSPSR
jgi:FixJ family two-component response regulator